LESCRTGAKSATKGFTRKSIRMTTRKVISGAIIASNLDGPRKTETYPNFHDSCVFGPNLS